MTRESTRSIVRRGDRALARAVFLLLLALYSATFVGVPELPDGELEFQGTSSLARRASLALGGTPEAELAAAHLAANPAPGALPIRHGAGARAQAIYSWYGVGQSAAALPLYGLGRVARLIDPVVEERHRARGIDGRGASEYFEHVLVGWRNPLLGAATAALLLLAARRLGCSRRRAFWAALAYGTTSFAWPQARSSLSDVQATFLLLLAFHLTLRVREGIERFELPRTRDVAAIGLALGCALLTRVAVLPICVVLAATAEVQLRLGLRWLARSRWTRTRTRARAGWRLSAALALPIAGCAVLLLLLNVLRFGDALDSGYGSATAGLFGGDPLLGLAGLLASPGRGLVWMAPLAVLAPLGLRRLWFEGVHLPALAIYGVALACLVVAAPMPGWGGAWTYGPRYLLPALPFLWLGSARVLAPSHGSAAGRGLVIGLCAFGLVVQLPGVLVDHTTHLDLAVRAAREEWPLPEVPEPDAEAARFEELQWDLRFAAPWAHWRILRHRAAGLGEQFPVREIFLLDSATVLEPSGPRQRGFRHLAWVDARERLGLRLWPAALLVVALFVVGLWGAARGLDESLG